MWVLEIIKNYVITQNILDSNYYIYNNFENNNNYSISYIEIIDKKKKIIFYDNIIYNFNICLEKPKYNWYQSPYIKNVSLLGNDIHDRPEYEIEWKDNKLIWKWKNHHCDEEWITPLEDIECWNIKCRILKRSGRLSCKGSDWESVKTWPDPKMLETMNNSDNKMCFVRTNRFNHQNEFAYWDPKTQQWTKIRYHHIMEELDPDIKLYCKVRCGCKTWRWLFLKILEEEDKVLLKWSGAIGPDD